MRIRRRTRTAAVIGGVALVVALGLWIYIGRRGSTGLERWLGTQIVGIVQTYITPKVSFRDIDYRAPTTVVLHDLRLTSDGLPIIAIERALLTLAERPRRGEPIRIARIALAAPQVEFHGRPGGGLKGWSDFVRQDPLKHPESVPEQRRLSEVLVLEHVSIRDGRVVYVDAAQPDDPMVLPGIHFTLDTPRVAQEQGAYRLVGTLERAPLFRLAFDGGINLDTGLLRFAELQLEAQIGERQYDTLPPGLQRLLAEHEVRGQLTLRAAGEIPLAEPQHATVQVDAALAGAHVALERFSAPMRELKVSGDLPGGPLSVTVSDFELNNGPVTLAGVEQLLVQIASLPVAGQALHISRAQIDRPLVTLLREPDGRLRGWQRLAEEAERRTPPAPALGGGTPAPAPLPDLRLDDLAIRGAEVVYGEAGGEPMRFDEIDADLAIRSTADTADADGLAEGVSVHARLTRPPLATATIDARYRPADGLLDVNRAECVVELQPEHADHLPAALARLIAAHELRGRITGDASGQIPLDDPASARVDATLRLLEAEGLLNGLRLAAGAVEISGPAPAGPFTATASDLALRDGDATLASLASARAELAALPLGGRRLHVRTATVEQPVVVIARAPDGGVEGWKRFAGDGASDGDGGGDDTGSAPARAGAKRGDATADAGVAASPDRAASPGVATSPDRAAPGGGAAAPGEAPIRLDDLRLRDAAVVVEWPGIEPVRVEGIDANVSLPASDAEGWPLRVQVRRAPWLAARVEAQWRPVAERVDVERLQLDVNLLGNDADLPPQLARFLRSHGVAGRLTASATGQAPIGAPHDTSLDVQAQLAGARFTYRGLAASVESAQVTGALPGGPLQLTLSRAGLSDGQFTLASAETAQAAVRSVPIGGRPLHVESLTLQRPMVALAREPTGGLRGWSKLASPDCGLCVSSAASPAAEPPPPAQARAQPAGAAPVRLEQVHVVNAELRYAAAGQARPLRLDGIQATLHMPPAADGAGHALRAEIERAPLLRADLQGVYRPDASRLDVSRLHLEATVGPQQVAAMPPQVAESVREHDLRGQLAVDASGQLALDNPWRSRLTVEGRVRDGQVAFGRTRWPAGELSVRAQLADGQASVALDGRALGGEARATAQLGVEPPRRGSLEWRVSNVRLEELLHAAGGRESPYAGVLSGSGEAAGALSDWRSTLNGGGQLEIRDGRLVRLPVIRQIVEMLGYTTLGLLDASDQATASFTLHPGYAQLQRAEVLTSVVGLEGAGRVYYDRRLDLKVTARPLGKLQRKVERGLGRLGELIGRVNEAIVYHVGGALNEPKITIRPLGLGG